MSTCDLRLIVLQFNTDRGCMMPGRNVVAISLPDALLKKLTKEAKDQNTSRSEVIRRSLLKLFAIRDFTLARNQSLNELASKGVHLTDEDIFKQVS